MYTCINQFYSLSVPLCYKRCKTTPFENLEKVALSYIYLHSRILITTPTMRSVVLPALLAALQALHIAALPGMPTTFACDGGYPLAAASRRLGLVFADDQSSADDVRTMLAADGYFESIEGIDARQAVPTLAQLQQFDAILLWSNYPFVYSEALGDIVAQYWDAGGVVVAVEFSFNQFNGNQIKGRFGDYANGYVLLDNAGRGYTCSNDQLGAVAEPNSPIMAGVASGAGHNCRVDVSIINGGVLVSSWSSTGYPLAVRGVRNGRNIVDLNVYPGYWPEPALLRNALLYSMCPAPRPCHCRPGAYCPNATTCKPVPCPAGHYCPAGAVAPTLCPAGFHCFAGMSAPKRTGCGFYSPPGASLATGCPPGTYCPAASSAPTPCPVGSYCTPLGRPCAPTPCRARSYCPAQGMSQPVRCPHGSTSPPGASACVPAP